MGAVGCAAMLTAAVVMALPGTRVSAQTVKDAVKFDVSPAIWSVPKPAAKAQAAFKKEHRVKRLPPLPIKEAAFADNVVQAQAAAKLPLAAIEKIEGIGAGLEDFDVTSFPADTTGAVGTTQYVQWVNTSLVVFDKASKAAVFGPRDGSALWQGFGRPFGERSPKQAHRRKTRARRDRQRRTAQLRALGAGRRPRSARKNGTSAIQARPGTLTVGKHSP